MYKNIQSLYLYFIIFISILLWITVPPNINCNNLYSILAGLGELTGVLGIVLFCLNMFLSARFKFLDKYFKGLNNLYIYHNNKSLSILIFSLINDRQYALNNWDQNIGKSVVDVVKERTELLIK